MDIFEIVKQTTKLNKILLFVLMCLVFLWIYLEIYVSIYKNRENMNSYQKCLEQQGLMTEYLKHQITCKKPEPKRLLDE